MPLKWSDTMIGVMVTGAVAGASRWFLNPGDRLGRGVAGATGHGIEQRVTVGEGTTWQPIFRTNSTIFWRPAGGSAMSLPCRCC